MASAPPLRRSRSATASRPRRPQGQRFHEAASLYGIPHWGKGFFHVSDEGDLVVRPTREAGRSVSLKKIVDEAALRGISTPMVIRFPQILSAAVANRRVLEPVEGHIALVAGAGLAGLALLAFKYPRGFAYPFAVVAMWVAAALLLRGCTLLREGHRRSRIQQ